jgi:integrase
MALTELMIKQACSKEKPYTMSDGQGLLLEVFPNGRKRWVIRYWVGGKERRTSVGTFPDVTLKEARVKNVLLRESLKAGGPIGVKAETFSTVAEEWIEKRMNPKCADSYLRTLNLRLRRLIFPHIGHMKLADITPAIVLELCRRLEAKGTLETASIVRQIIGQIFNYGIATNRVETNPTLALRGALQTRKEKHYSAITQPDKIGLLMRQIEVYPYAIVLCALKFSALTFCRPGEIRKAEWSEIDWEREQWNISEEKMKMGRPHIVPLARQAIKVLEKLKTMTGHQQWLFPSSRNDGRCMSENTIRVALRAMGYGNADMTAHGFRAMASTTLYNNGFPANHIEKQLAHAEKNSVVAAYNHAEYLPQRKEMMQWYADWLESQKNALQ